ncbi:unnamed protein product, partial [Mesorhabditis belari]|uniref:Uncharacterized protein n=1 Tax=Mesorhabditis belari TaxID=2138241 RepID=A0AAF3FGY9_9BILA
MVDAGPIVGGNVCNEGTEWQCECTRCWEQFEEIPGLEWIRLGLDECSKVNASRLGEKLAGWLNEECASFVSCALSLPIASSQILIGHWGCEKKSTEIRVLLLKNRHGNLSSTGQSF